MKRRIIVIIAILMTAILVGVAYINELVLSPKVKSIILDALEEGTGKKVILGSVHFNISRGIVLKDLIIYDGNRAIINVRTSSCAFLIHPLLKKDVVIPSVRFDSPELYIERRPDGSFNIFDLFSHQKTAGGPYRLIVRRITVKDADVVFRDNSLERPFSKEIRGLCIDAYLALPAKVKFECSASIPGDPVQKLSLSGEYLIPPKELRSDIRISDFSPEELNAYLEKYSFSLPDGKIDADIKISSKQGALAVIADARTRKLLFAWGGLSGSLDSDIEASAEYRFSDRSFTYSGSVDIGGMELNGVESVDRIEGIKGNFVFDNTGLSCENLRARSLGLEMEGRLFLADFSNPLLNIEVGTAVSLSDLERILKENLKIKLPADITGEGRLFANIHYDLFQPGSCQAEGYLDTKGSRIVFGDRYPALEDVTGRFDFTSNQLRWSALTFAYGQARYETHGIVTNFDVPGVQMSIASDELSVDAIFSAGEKRLVFSKMDGRYLNSRFSMYGGFDTAAGAKGHADFSGTARIDLGDLKQVFKGSKEKLDKMKLSGVMRADFGIKGDMSDIMRYSVDARLTSDSVSVYGLKTSALSLDYRQEAGVADIRSLRASLYGGTLDAASRIDLTVKEMPYSVSADLAGVKLEQLKNDTGLRDKVIAGSVRMKVKLQGSSDDLSLLTGQGRIDITDGNLWQLNLFKGLGVLLFTRDFSNVIFTEGGLDFVIKDKSMSTDDFELKSSLVDLYGKVSIDFQNSIDALLKAEFTDEAIESRAVKGVTTAIGRYSLIDIKGTLKDPKYRIKADMPSIVEDLAEAMLQR